MKITIKLQEAISPFFPEPQQSKHLGSKLSMFVNAFEHLKNQHELTLPRDIAMKLAHRMFPQKAGSGSSRHVFHASPGVVLKVAKYADGEDHNQKETFSEMHEALPDLFPHVLAYDDEDFSWIAVQAVQVISTPEQFLDVLATHAPEIHQDRWFQSKMRFDPTLFGDYLSRILPGIEAKSSFVVDLQQAIEQFGVEANEIDVGNVGLVRRRGATRPVLLDASIF